MRRYYATPEGCAKMRANARAFGKKYRKRPEVIKKRKTYHKTYRRLPHVIEAYKTYYARYINKPGVRERRNEYYRNYQKQKKSENNGKK